MLSQLLFEPVQLPKSRGRPIRFDADEPSIELMTGTLEERVANLLLKCGYPMTTKEIASGIRSNASQVAKGLRKLIDQGKVEMIDLDGCVREYILSRKN